MPTTPLFAFSGKQVVPLKNPTPAMHMDVVELLDGTYLAGTLLGSSEGNVEQQTLAYAGAAATSGNFTLTFGGDTTANIAFNASASAIAAALNLLASITTAGGVTASGGPVHTTPVVISFVSEGNVAAITVNDVDIAGGAGVPPAITTSQAGEADANKYGAYLSSAVNGLQNPTHILEYDVLVSSGIHYLGDTALGEWRRSEHGAPAYRGGLFACADLVGLDATAVTNMKARLIQGDISTGRILIPA